MVLAQNFWAKNSNMIAPIKFLRRSRSNEGNSNHFKCNNSTDFIFESFSNAVHLCANYGGIENPLTETPILTDENYRNFSNWSISKSSVKKYFIENSENEGE